MTNRNNIKITGLLLLLASQLLITIGFWLWNHVHDPMGNQLTGEAVGQVLAYGRLAGLLATLAVLFQVMLIGRVKWIETVFGHDRLVHLHRVFGLFIVIFFISHPLLVTFGHATSADVSLWAQFVDFCLNWDDVLAAVIGQTIFIVAIIMSIVIIRKQLRYEVWYVSHLTLYIALALTFGHQLEVGSDFTSNRWFAAYWYILYAFVFGNLLYYRVIRPLRFFVRHRFKISQIVPESGDVNSVYIEGRALERFAMASGQFVIVRFWAKGFRWEAHPFSLSLPPDGKRIRLSIKALGDFTRRIGSLKPGTPVLIDGPHGIFTAAHCRSAKALLIAGGIGITPLRALAEELSAAGREVTLLYANRTRKDIVFAAELAALTESSAGRLSVIHVLSNDPEWTGERGRIDREKIIRLVPDLEERDVFLCGPPEMSKGIRKILSGLDIPSGQIHFEKFSL